MKHNFFPNWQILSLQSSEIVFAYCYDEFHAGVMVMSREYMSMKLISLSICREVEPKLGVSRALFYYSQ